MGTNNQEIAKYLLLIKKLTNIKIKDPDHRDLKDDVVQDVFLKLYKTDFFSTNDLNTSEDNNRQINGYIVKAIRSCYMDQLKLRGINRRLTRSEAEASGNRYESIQTQAIDDTDENNFISSPTEGPDQYVFIREAYNWIESCFNSASSDMKDTVKRSFFNAAFWEFDNYGLPMKELALYLGYTSSNPTQELKRFAEKVSLCTGPHGILINNPHEQIQFLREQLENTETGS
jgi:DNA-directed RNA polymerase specialized sigma24 family protein